MKVKIYDLQGTDPSDPFEAMYFSFKEVLEGLL